jgi:hypothetical protein
VDQLIHVGLQYQDWTAIHDFMSKTLRVDGTVVVEGGGFAVSLEAREGNQGINPQMFTLDLVVTPTGESPSHQTVHYDQPWRDDGIDYNEVGFRVRGADTEPPPPLKIEDLQ